MGLQAWADLPQGFEDLKEREYTGDSKEGQWFDVRGLSNFGFALPSACIANQDSGDCSLQTGSSGASGVSYEGNNTSHLAGRSGDSTEDAASLSLFLKDGNVRAMLKKVTVNEGALNQAIQSLGGGEKGLKELMGYIMSWVREHKGGEKFSFSQNLEKLRNVPPVNPPAFGYVATSTCSSSLGDGPPHNRLQRLETVQSTNVVHDLNQFYQPCTKSRRLMEGERDTRYGVYRGSGNFVDVRSSTSEEFQYPKLETTSMGGSSSRIGPVMLQGIQELQQQPVASLQSGFLSFGSGHEGLSRTLAATTRAARRNRIMRQRQSVQQSLPRAGNNGAAISSAFGLCSVAPPTLSTGRCHQGDQMAPTVSIMKVNNADMLTILLQKELRPSDVGNLGRIILPKKEAEMHLPILALREGVLLQMEDFGSGCCWNIRYRFWPNNRSRMYLLENTGEFVKSHHLQEGDLLIIYRNQQGNYVLRGKKVHSQSRGGAQGLQQKNAHSLASGFPEASKTKKALKERDFGVKLEDQFCQKVLKERVGLEDRFFHKEVLKERDFGMELEHRSCQKAVKAEPTVLEGDDDPFFKEEVMHNISSTFGPESLQPLERFPSLNLDFSLDEIMVGIPKDDNENEPNLVVPKTEPAG